MSFDEYIRQLRNVYKDMCTELPMKISTWVGVDMETQIRERVETKGKDSNGGNFSGYSTRAGYFTTDKKPGVKKLSPPTGKAWDSDGKKRSKFKNGEPHKTKYLERGYTQLREEVGRNVTNTKNFSMTGQMWRDFGVKKIDKLKDGYVSADLGGKGKYSQDLIDLHSGNEGISIIATSKEEQDIFEEKVENWIRESFKL